MADPGTKNVSILSFPTVNYKDKYNLPASTSVEHVDGFHDMEVRKEDIFIVTYPKSGTHWMQELVHLILADGDSSKVGPAQRVPPAEMVGASIIKGRSPSAPPVFRTLRDAPSPRVFTTHVPCAQLPKQIWQKECKVIYVCRHPKDAICSFYNFYRKLISSMSGVDLPDTPEQFDAFFQSALRSEAHYGSWFDHVLEYYGHKDKKYFLFVTFEEMKKDIAPVIRRVSSFIGHDVDDGTVQKIIHGSSFDTMKASFSKDNVTGPTGEMSHGNHQSVFFNKGTTAQWKARFTEEQNAAFDKVFQEKMKDCELTGDYAST